MAQKVSTLKQARQAALQDRIEDAIPLLRVHKVFRERLMDHIVEPVLTHVQVIGAI